MIFLILHYKSITANWLPSVLVYGFLFIFSAVIFVGGRLIYAQKMKYRKTVAPICGWEYSVVEWRQYAKDYDYSVYPNGSAEVKITPLDIWIMDDKSNVNKELDGIRRCVTDCRIANQMLKFRVRYVRGGTQYYVYDYQLSVPVGKEVVASKAIEYFKKKMAENGSKIAQVTSPDAISGSFGETDF